MKLTNIWILGVPVLILALFFVLNKKKREVCPFDRTLYKSKAEFFDDIKIHGEAQQILIDNSNHIVLNYIDKITLLDSVKNERIVYTSHTGQPLIGMSIHNRKLAVHEANKFIVMIDLISLKTKKKLISKDPVLVRRHCIFSDSLDVIVSLDKDNHSVLCVVDQEGLIKNKFNVFPRTNDLGITNGGFFSKDDSGNIFYRYCYRDSVLVLDVTAIRAIYFRPIDRCGNLLDVIHDNVGYRPGKNMKCNRQVACHYNNNMYILSDALSQRTPDSLRGFNTIDIYSGPNYTYAGTIYIEPTGSIIRDMSFDKTGILCILYNHGLIRKYKLS